MVVKLYTSHTHVNNKDTSTRLIKRSCIVVHSTLKTVTIPKQTNHTYISHTLSYYDISCQIKLHLFIFPFSPLSSFLIIKISFSFVKWIFRIIMTKKRNEMSHLIIPILCIMIRHDVPFLLSPIKACP
jgi:hypothetical protein